MNGAIVLAVDPGRDKCGIAVVAAGPQPAQRTGRVAAGPRVLARGVVATGELADTAARWAREFGVNLLALGDRTGSEEAGRALATALPHLPLHMVDEAGTTEDARARYFAEHPSRGWRRLVPVGMQVPSEPYDDYVAILLAERVLAARPGPEQTPGDGPVGSAGKEEKP